MKRIGTLVLAAVLFSACGGGGGGGGGGEASTGVRIIHGAIDAVPFDLISSAVPGAVVTSGTFGIAPSYSTLPEGAQNISLIRARVGGETLSTTTVAVESGQRRTLVVYGDNEQFGVRTSVLLDDQVKPESGNARLRLVDAMTGAQSIRARVGNTLSLDANFGQGSDYQSVPTGVYNITAVRASDSSRVWSGTVTLEEGRSYSLAILGEAGYFVLGELLQDR